MGQRIVEYDKKILLLITILFSLFLISNASAQVYSKKISKKYQIGDYVVHYILYGEETDLRVRMGFDLTEIPEDMRIINATLGLRIHTIYARITMLDGEYETIPTPLSYHEILPDWDYNITPFAVEDLPKTCWRVLDSTCHARERVYTDVSSLVTKHYETDKRFDFILIQHPIQYTEKPNFYIPDPYPYLLVYYEPLIVEEVKSSIVAPSDYYLEENNTAILTANITGTGFNITYDDKGGSDVYLTFNETTEKITVPFFRHYDLPTGIYNFTFNIYPFNESVWDGFTQTVEKPDGTVDTYEYYVPNITVGYRYPLYSYELAYPKTMYMVENNTLRLKAIPNVNYTYAKANVTILYSQQESKVYFQDNIQQFEPVEITVPFEKTYYETYQPIKANFTVYPFENYTHYIVDGGHTSLAGTQPYAEVTFNKSKEPPPEDPDYIEVRYRYPPITYPLEGKVLLLQFHKFEGNWEQVGDCLIDGNCTYDESLNKWTCENIGCQEMLNSIRINCRTCGTENRHQLVQYFTNETDCQWLNGTLSGLEYWHYPITMILQDRNVCSDYNLTKDITGFDYRGSLTSIANRDKFIFYNSTRTDQATQYVDYADAFGLQISWEQGTGIAKVKDNKGKKQTETDDIYTVDIEITDNHATFYIANKHPKTIWLDEIRIPNTFTYEYLQSIDAFYTTHSGKKVDLQAEYNSATDEVIVTPVKSNKKIPIEPATGSNILKLVGNPSSTGFIVGLLPLLVGVGLVLFTVRTTLEGGWDLERIVAIIIAIIIGVALLGVLFAMV